MKTLYNCETEHKSNHKADIFRILGNDCYKKNQMFDALMNYNKSIAYSCSNDVLSMGFASRSAVFFEIGCYDECLKNIQLARENGYKKDLQLFDREEKCKKLLERSDENAENFWDCFKLSYSANEKIPWIVDCLEMRFSEKFGRGIYAMQDLKAGDIICVEQPIVHFFLGDGRYRHCYNCFKTSMLNLIPCARTASMMFCSTECMGTFYSKSRDLGIALNPDIKMLTEIAAPFPEKEDELDNFMHSIDVEMLTKTIYDFDFSDPKDPDYQKNLITCYLSLSTSDNHGLEENSCQIFNCVSKKTSNHLLGIPVLNIASCNYFDGSDRALNDGMYVSLFRSLLNHSCAPNVFSLCVDNKNVIIVTKPIEAGEQLFRAYFNINIKNPYSKYERSSMFNLHGFQCDCEICIDENHDVTCSEIFPPVFDKEDISEAKSMLEEGWNYINDKSITPQDMLINKELNTHILHYLAYHCSFPC